ncbi:MAG: acetyl-CoA carboxylase biotin carboxyl carrier protein subunit [Flavobacteriales bacterium]|nr:acetyl-CoA carboxylase biotin carboxyl carrier protein subunit [Flavobacteriales bacterium]|tara:strand:- start:4624 stop:5091 length:468 start_codon:yes stop_codon:yes gene_type:complete
MKGIVNNRFNFELDKMVNWDIVKFKEGRFHIVYNNKSFVADVLTHNRINKSFVIIINNNTYSVQLKDRFDELLDDLGMDVGNSNKGNDVKAPMPGRVLEVLVKEGDTIAEGDGLIVLEAMKMENIIKSTRRGVLKCIQTVEGDNVEKNTVLLSFE